MTSPKQSHLAATKRIMRYLKGTKNCGILFPNQKEKGDLHLVGYTQTGVEIKSLLILCSYYRVLQYPGARGSKMLLLCQPVRLSI